MRTRTDVQLHIFCDASEQAFASVAYLRIAGPSGIDIAFIMSKTRVAPLKPISIPRLELQAAVMGSRLATCIKDGHAIDVGQVYYWTDSRTVLCWIRSDARRYKQFVSHRVGEILEASEVSEWHWIPTALNVADDATRDIKPVELHTNSRWLKGPPFLLEPKDSWPKEEIESKPTVQPDTYVELELKREFVAVHCDQKSCLPDVHRFSSLIRLLRTTARVLKFPQLCRKRKQNVSQKISTSDLDEAELRWIQLSQQQCFGDELDHMMKKKNVLKSSRLYMLSPIMDNKGIMRVTGRIENADVSTDVKSPIILDPKHPFTKLLIKHQHEQSNHCGQETVLNELRQRFWILNARAAVRKTWASCNMCRIRRAKRNQPQMGLLPECKLKAGDRPFTYTGVDYFGPMEVTVKRRREKRYGVLFTCLTTRAVHLELAISLSTNSCMMAIRRFISRRGQPDEFWSDNGKNFRGADNELRAAFKELQKDEFLERLALKRIRWNFNPPSTPHLGGCWERLVRSVKTSLRVVLKECAPREEVLLTLLH